MPSEGKTRQLGEVQSTGSEGVPDEPEASSASRRGRPGETRSRREVRGKPSVERKERVLTECLAAREDQFPPAVTSRESKNEETVDIEVDSTDQT